MKKSALPMNKEKKKRLLVCGGIVLSGLLIAGLVGLAVRMNKPTVDAATVSRPESQVTTERVLSPRTAYTQTGKIGGLNLKVLSIKLQGESSAKHPIGIITLQAQNEGKNPIQFYKAVILSAKQGNQVLTPAIVSVNSEINRQIVIEPGNTQTIRYAVNLKNKEEVSLNITDYSFTNAINLRIKIQSK
jgi:hypothetical protein